MRTGPENLSETARIAIREQFGRIDAINDKRQKIVQYSPTKGYLKFESTSQPVENMQEAYVLLKNPKTIVRRFLETDDSEQGDPLDIIELITDEEDVTIDFEYPMSDRKHLVKHLPSGSTIAYQISVPDEYYGGPEFARIDLNKNFIPKGIYLPFLDKKGLLENTHEYNGKKYSDYVGTFNPIAYLDLTKKGKIEISTENAFRDLKKRGSFLAGELFRLPDTNHGYRVTHENNEWAFSQYNLEDMENPRLIKKVGVRDIEMKDVNAALKGDLKAWSSLPERILTPIINN